MNGLGLFLGTLAAGVVWLVIGPYVIGAAEYGADHAGGWLIGLTPEEVNDARKWREKNE